MSYGGAQGVLIKGPLPQAPILQAAPLTNVWESYLPWCKALWEDSGWMQVIAFLLKWEKGHCERGGGTEGP